MNENVIVIIRVYNANEEDNVVSQVKYEKIKNADKSYNKSQHSAYQLQWKYLSFENLHFFRNNKQVREEPPAVVENTL